MIPCAERAQFLKSGAEAVSAAVRLARTYTGRDRVVASGYFGWHDWSIDGAGVPEAVRADVVHVPFGDVSALDRAARDAGSSLAAIVLEPVVEHEPPQDWLARARALCDELGAALVFDEVKTGFRLASGGYQQVCGVTPDLAAVGKRWRRVSALRGGRKAPLMDAARRTWNLLHLLASEATALLRRRSPCLTGTTRQTSARSLPRSGARCCGGGARDHDYRRTRRSGPRRDAMWLLHWYDAARENRLCARRSGVVCFSRRARPFCGDRARRGCARGCGNIGGATALSAMVGHD